MSATRGNIHKYLGMTIKGFIFLFFLFFLSIHLLYLLGITLIFFSLHSYDSLCQRIRENRKKML